MGDYSREADLWKVSALTPEEQLENDEYEHSAAVEAEFSQAIASQRDPRKRAFLQEAYDRDFGGAKAQAQPADDYDPIAAAMARAQGTVPARAQAKTMPVTAADPDSDDYDPIEAAMARAQGVPKVVQEDGDFVRSVKNGLPQLNEQAGAVQALLGEGMRRTFGEGEVGNYLRKAGLERMASAKGKQVGKESDSFSNASDKGVLTVATDWLPYQAGQIVNSVAESILLMAAGAGVGAVASGPAAPAGAVVGGIGVGVGGLLTKSLISKGVVEAAKKLAVDEGEEVARKFVLRETGKTAALLLGAAEHGVGEVGSRAIEEAKGLEGVDFSKVIPAAIMHAAGEFYGDSVIRKALFNKEPANLLGKSLSGRVAGGALGVAVKEVPVEVGQTAAERYGAGLSLTNDAAKREYVDSAAAAAAMGVTGGVGGVRQHYAEKSFTEALEQQKAEQRDALAAAEAEQQEQQAQQAQARSAEELSPAESAQYARAQEEMYAPAQYEQVGTREQFNPVAEGLRAGLPGETYDMFARQATPTQQVQQVQEENDPLVALQQNYQQAQLEYQQATAVGDKLAAARAQQAMVDAIEQGSALQPEQNPAGSQQGDMFPEAPKPELTVAKPRMTAAEALAAGVTVGENPKLAEAVADLAVMDRRGIGKTKARTALEAEIASLRGAQNGVTGESVRTGRSEATESPQVETGSPTGSQSAQGPKSALVPAAAGRAAVPASTATQEQALADLEARLDATMNSKIAPARGKTPDVVGRAPLDKAGVAHVASALHQRGEKTPHGPFAKLHDILKRWDKAIGDSTRANSETTQGKHFENLSALIRGTKGNMDGLIPLFSVLEDEFGTAGMNKVMAELKKRGASDTPGGSPRGERAGINQNSAEARLSAAWSGYRDGRLASGETSDATVRNNRLEEAIDKALRAQGVSVDTKLKGTLADTGSGGLRWVNNTQAGGEKHERKGRWEGKNSGVMNWLRDVSWQGFQPHEQIIARTLYHTFKTRGQAPSVTFSGKPGGKNEASFTHGHNAITVHANGENHRALLHELDHAVTANILQTAAMSKGKFLTNTENGRAAEKLRATLEGFAKIHATQFAEFKKTLGLEEGSAALARLTVAVKETIGRFAKAKTHAEIRDAVTEFDAYGTTTYELQQYMKWAKVPPAAGFALSKHAVKTGNQTGLVRSNAAWASVWDRFVNALSHMHYGAKWTGGQQNVLDQFITAHAELGMAATELNPEGAVGKQLASKTPTRSSQRTVEADASWERSGEENGMPTWENKHVSLRDPVDITRNADDFYIGEEGRRVVQYKLRSPSGEVVGSLSLELEGDWPTMVLDIEVSDKHKGHHYGEHAIAGLLQDAGELTVFNIRPSALTWWEDRLGTHTDGVFGTLQKAAYNDARATRENAKQPQGGSKEGTRGDVGRQLYSEAPSFPANGQPVTTTAIQQTDKVFYPEHVRRSAFFDKPLESIFTALGWQGKAQRGSEAFDLAMQAFDKLFPQAGMWARYVGVHFGQPQDIHQAMWRAGKAAQHVKQQANKLSDALQLLAPAEQQQIIDYLDGKAVAALSKNNKIFADNFRQAFNQLLADYADRVEGTENSRAAIKSKIKDAKFSQLLMYISKESDASTHSFSTAPIKAWLSAERMTIKTTNVYADPSKPATVFYPVYETTPGAGGKPVTSIAYMVADNFAAPPSMSLKVDRSVGWFASGVDKLDKDSVTFSRNTSLAEAQKDNPSSNHAIAIVNTVAHLSRVVQASRFAEGAERTGREHGMVFDTREDVEKAAPWMKGGRILSTSELNSLPLKEKRFVRRSDQWVRVPDDSKLHGALAGKFVSGDLWGALTDYYHAEPLINIPAVNTVMRWFKANKTKWSPGTHLVNASSNVGWMYLHDIPVRAVADGIRIFYKANANPSALTSREAAVWEAFDKSGVLVADYSMAELGKFLSDTSLASLQGHTRGLSLSSTTAALLMYEKAKASKLAQKVFKSAEAADKFAQDMYSAEDSVFRLAAFMSQAASIEAKQKRRLTEAELDATAKQAAEEFLDYGIHARGVNMAKQTVLPFISWPYRAVPALIKITLTKPWKAAGLLGMYAALDALATSMSGGDEEDERKRKVLLPHMNTRVFGVGAHSYIQIPGLGTDEKPVYFNFGASLPGSDTAKGNSQGGFMGQTWIPSAITPNGPLVSTVMGALGGIDSFTGRPLGKTTDSQWEAFNKRAQYLVGQIAPPALDPKKLGEKWERVVNDKRGPLGEEYDATYELLPVLGIRVTQVDLAAAASRQAKAVNAITMEYKKASAAIQKEARLYANPDLEKVRERQAALLERMKEKLNDVKNIED